MTTYHMPTHHEDGARCTRCRADSTPRVGDRVTIWNIPGVVGTMVTEVRANGQTVVALPGQPDWPCHIEDLTLA